MDDKSYPQNESRGTEKSKAGNGSDRTIQLTVRDRLRHAGASFRLDSSTVSYDNELDHTYDM